MVSILLNRPFLGSILVRSSVCVFSSSRFRRNLFGANFEQDCRSAHPRKSDSTADRGTSDTKRIQSKFAALLLKMTPAPDFFVLDSTAGIYIEGSHSPVELKVCQLLVVPSL